MADVSKINPDGTEYNLKDATARTNIGNLASLHTTAKNDAVSAINEVKDEQANKADNDIVADAFNAAETYAEGDYCTYEGGLYKFKTAHEGAWDAADVDQIQIAGELSELKSGLTSVSAKHNKSYDGTVSANGLDTQLLTVADSVYQIITGFEISNTADVIPLQIFFENLTTIKVRLRNVSNGEISYSLRVFYV